MSGFMLCFDLMEMVGKEVVKKREQDTLDYWIDLSGEQAPLREKPLILYHGGLRGMVRIYTTTIAISNESLANRYGICHALLELTTEAEDLGGLTILQTMKQDALQLGLLDLDDDQYFGSLAFRKHMAREVRDRVDAGMREAELVGLEPEMMAWQPHI